MRFVRSQPHQNWVMSYQCHVCAKFLVTCSDNIVFKRNAWAHIDLHHIDHQSLINSKMEKSPPVISQISDWWEWDGQMDDPKTLCLQPQILGKKTDVYKFCFGHSYKNKNCNYVMASQSNCRSFCSCSDTLKVLYLLMMTFTVGTFSFSAHLGRAFPFVYWMVRQS